MSNNLLDRLRAAVDRERSRPAEEQAAAEAAEAERLASYPPEVLAAAELLGSPPDEVAEVVDRAGDTWIATVGSAVPMVYVPEDHPDGAGRTGLMLGRPNFGDWDFLPSPLPVFTPRGPVLAELKVLAVQRVEVDPDPEPWRQNPRLLVLGDELARARAWLAEAGEGDRAYATEAVAALELSVARIEAELRGAHLDAHPAAPSPDEVADRVAVVGWAVAVLTASTDREVEAARSTWGAVRAPVFSLPPHRAADELRAVLPWFAQHGEHAAMWSDVDLDQAQRVLDAVDRRGPVDVLLPSDRTRLQPPVVLDEPAR